MPWNGKDYDKLNLKTHLGKLNGNGSSKSAQKLIELGKQILQQNKRINMTKV